MALEYFTSGPLLSYPANFTAKCIAELGGTVSEVTSNKSFTFSGLFSDETTRDIYFDKYDSRTNIRFWYDIDNCFAMLTYNHNDVQHNFYNTTNNIAWYVMFPLIVFKYKDEITYLKRPIVNDFAVVKQYIASYPFYAYNNPSAFEQITSFVKIDNSLIVDGNNITLIPFIIGACVIPNLYLSIDSIAMTDQIVTMGEDKYKCLDSRLFYKIT